MNHPLIPPSNGLEIERNSLAQQRTKLAIERTFLSWIRTGITSIGLGLAIVRLLFFQNVLHEQLAHLAGKILIGWGISVFFLALLSYYKTYRQLPLPAKQGIPFMGLVIATLILAIASGILLWIIL